ncbi:MAG: sensor histidine kinase [Gemmatimonadales bacterium]
MSALRPRRPRGVFVAVLLVLTLVLATLLAIQAQLTALYHRATAESVLRDYAAFAAARYAARTAQELYASVVAPTLAPLQRGNGAHRLPGPAELGAGGDVLTRRFLAHGRYAFALTFAGRRLRTGGAPPPPAEVEWLVDTLTGHARAEYGKDWYFATLLGSSWLILYRVARDPQGVPLSAVGLVADPAALEPVLAAVTEEPLLPRALTRGVIYDSLGSVVVRDRRGTTLYQSPRQFASPFTGRDSLGAYLAGLQVEVTLRPEAARRLVIGGLPKSRLPFLLGLLALTAALIGAALLQLRREYELAQLRTDFVSSVSHELRTPLAQIRMFGETLLLDRVRSEEERRRSLAIVDQEARRLTHLVENLLYFSRAERRVARLALEPTDLGAMVREVVEGFAPLAASRGIAIRAEAPAKGDIVISADPGALRQMLLNLLDNAVKYGPPGQTIAVGAALTDRGARARLWVDDQGPGVPPGERERIWERFWRPERHHDSAVAGTGIGLAIVRELATLHQGRAWVEPAPATDESAGARFVIELPATDPSSGPTA